MSERILELAAVSWDDALYTDTEISLGNIPGLAHCYSVGWVVEENDKYIALSQEVFPQHFRCWRHVTVIPKVNITRTQRFTVTWEENTE